MLAIHHTRPLAARWPIPLPCRVRHRRASGYKPRKGEAATANRIVVRIDWTECRPYAFETHIRVQSCHSDINARFALNVIGVGLLESSFGKDVFRQFNHVDVVVVAAPHGGKQSRVVSGSQMMLDR